MQYLHCLTWLNSAFCKVADQMDQVRILRIEVMHSLFTQRKEMREAKRQKKLRHSWAYMPVEVASHVVEYLPIGDHLAVASADMLLRFLVLQGWKNMTQLHIYAQHVSAESLRAILMHTSADQLQSVRLERCWPLTSDHIRVLTQYYGRIRDLSLSKSIYLRLEHVALLFKSMQQLESVDFSYCPALGNALNAPILPPCPSIQVLDLSFTAVTDLTFQALVGSCPNLKQLHVRRSFANNSCSLRKCTYCSKANVKMMYCSRCRQTPYCSKACLEADWTKEPYEHRVMCDIIRSRISCSDSDLIHVSQTNPQLQSLDVSGNRSISHVSMNKIAEKCTDLRELYLSRCWKVQPNGLLFILNTCLKLSQLHICGSVKRSPGHAAEFDRIIDTATHDTPSLKACCSSNNFPILAQHYPVKLKISL